MPQTETPQTIECFFHDEDDFEDTAFVADKLCSTQENRTFLETLATRYAAHGMKASLSRDEANRLIDIATTME